MCDVKRDHKSIRSHHVSSIQLLKDANNSDPMIEYHHFYSVQDVRERSEGRTSEICVEMSNPAYHGVMAGTFSRMQSIGKFHSVWRYSSPESIVSGSFFREFYAL